MSDPTFRTSAPLDQLAEARRELDLLALWPGAAPSRDGDVVHTHRLELRLHRCFAIAAVSGDRLGHLGEELRDPGDGRSEHGRIGRVALLDDVVENDALGVVGDVSLVTELDGAPQPSGARQRKAFYEWPFLAWSPLTNNTQVNAEAHRQPSQRVETRIPLAESRPSSSATLLQSALVLVDEPPKRRPTSNTDRPKLHQIEAALSRLVLAHERLRASYRLPDVQLPEASTITNITQ